MYHIRAESIARLRPHAPIHAKIPPMRDRDRRLVDELLTGYRRGLFPMNHPELALVCMCDADPRGVMPLTPEDGLRVPRRLARTIRSGRFEITSDRAFARVVRACAEPRTPSRDSESVSADTWIDHRIIYACERLFDAGHAHSIEAWRDGSLVGGIYAVTLGGLIAGESMFTRPSLGGTDASKVCLVHALLHARRRGFTLFDTQFLNPHIQQFGCFEMDRDEYQRRLDLACDLQVTWEPFDPHANIAELARRGE